MELQGTIGTTWEYFLELEHATRLLNYPGESLVLRSDFLCMVECVDILSSSNPTYDRFSPFASCGVAHTGDSAITEKQKSTSCVSSNA